MPICPLCLILQPDSAIRRSHIVPAFCYRQLTRKLGRDPLVVAASPEKPRQKQTREKMLCGLCEARFKVAEDYFRSVAYDQHGDCPLFKMASYSSPVRSSEHVGEPHRVVVDTLDMERLAYFAVSVFWRASVAASCRFELSPTLREPFRRYLMGERDLPRHVSVVFVVVDQPRYYEGEDFTDVVALPWRVELETAVSDQVPTPYTASSFAACGFFFRLMMFVPWPAAPPQVLPVVTFQAANQLPELRGMSELIRYTVDPP